MPIVNTNMIYFLIILLQGYFTHSYYIEYQRVELPTSNPSIVLDAIILEVMLDGIPTVNVLDIACKDDDLYNDQSIPLSITNLNSSMADIDDTIVTEYGLHDRSILSIRPTIELNTKSAIIAVAKHNNVIPKLNARVRSSGSTKLSEYLSAETVLSKIKDEERNYLNRLKNQFSTFDEKPTTNIVVVCPTQLDKIAFGERDYITFSAFHNDSQIHIYDATENLHIEDAWSLLPLTGECGDIPLFNNDTMFNLDSIPNLIPLPPIDAPQLGYLHILKSSTNSYVDSPDIGFQVNYNNNKIVNALILSSKDYLTKNVTTVTKQYLFYNKQCSFELPIPEPSKSLARDITEPKEIALIEKILECDSEHYQLLKSVFLNEMLNLSISNPFELTQKLANIYFITSSYGWQGCLQYIHSNFLKEDDFCKTESSANDPCCYPDLTDSCCSRETMLYSIDNDAVDTLCSSDCAKDSLQTYLNALNARDDSFNEKLGDYFSDIPPLQICFEMVYGQPCYDDDDCDGENICVVSEITDLYRHCSIPCKNDNDCPITNRCITGVSLQGENQRTCSVLDFGRGVKDNSTQKFVECLWDAKNKNVFLNMVVSGSFEIDTYEEFYHSLTYEGCTDLFSETKEECDGLPARRKPCYSSLDDALFTARVLFHSCSIENGFACCNPNSTDFFCTNEEHYCESQSRCVGDISLLTEEDCHSARRCESNGQVLPASNELECNSLGICDDYSGCAESTQSCCKIKSPYGCIVDKTKRECNGTWIEKAITYEQCNSKKQKMCGQDMKSCHPYTFNWTNGSWVPYAHWFPQYVLVESVQQIGHYFWTDFVNYDVFLTWWAEARSYQLKSSVSKFLSSNLKEPSELISTMLCSCQQKNNTCYGEGLNNLYSVLLGINLACPGVVGNFNFEYGEMELVNKIKSNFSNCVEAKIYSIPTIQFNTSDKVGFSSLSLSPGYQTFQNRIEFVQNSNGFVVGHLVNERTFQFVFDSMLNVEFSICFDTIPKGQYPHSEMGITKENGVLGIVLFENNIFIPLLIENGTNKICITESNIKKSEFIISLALINKYLLTVENNQQLFTTGDIAAISILEIFTLALLIVAVGTFFREAIRVRSQTKKKSIWSLSTMALFTISIHLLNRAIYFPLIYTGALVDFPAALIIFTELPFLLFFTTLSTVVIKWIEIAHYSLETKGLPGLSKLKPVLVGLNFLMYGGVVILIIVFSVLQSTKVNYLCGQGSNVSPKDIVALVYKGLYLIICILLFLGFAIYGSKLTRGLIKTTVSQEDKNRSHIIKLTALSVIACISVIAQASYTLFRSIEGYMVPILDILMFILFFEILPAGVLVFTFALTFQKKIPNQSNSFSSKSTKRTKNSDESNPTFVSSAQL